MTAFALATLIAAAAPASADPLPDPIPIHIASRLAPTELVVRFPDGRSRVLGHADREQVELPAGSTVELAPGEVRRYRGLLTVTRGDDGLVLVLETPREAYLAGVVASEIGADAPAAALESQAVVSRTLLIDGRTRHPDGPAPLCDLTHCQSFRGEPDADAPWEAVRRTAGRVLAVDGSPVEAPFHSTCGGHTLAAADVWGHDAPHLRGVADLRDDGKAWCAASPHGAWTAAVAASDLPDPAAGPDTFRLEVGRRHGWNVVKSNRFTATLLTWSGRAIWWVEGHGLGHGVGLCQHGAIGRAAAGATVEEILGAYFQGVAVR